MQKFFFLKKCVEYKMPILMIFLGIGLSDTPRWRNTKCDVWHEPRSSQDHQPSSMLLVWAVHQLHFTETAKEASVMADVQRWDGSLYTLAFDDRASIQYMDWSNLFQTVVIWWRKNQKYIRTRRSMNDFIQLQVPTYQFINYIYMNKY